MFILFVLLFSILFLLLAIKRIDWAVLLVIASLPAYIIRFDIFGVPSTMLEVMIYLVFAVWFLGHSGFYETIKKGGLRGWFKRKGKKRYPFDTEIILLMATSIIAVGISGFGSSAFGIWKAYFFDPVLFYIVLVNIFKKDDFKKIFWAFGLSALAISLFSIFQKLTGAFIDNELWRAEATRRITGVFGYPNAVGLFLGPIIILFLGWAIKSISELKSTLIISNFQFPISKQIQITKFQILKTIFIICVIVTSFLAIYYAKSEGALIGILVALVLFGILVGGKIRWVTIFAVMILGIGVLSYSPARNYAFDKLTLNDFSGQVRKLQWTETWNMLRDARMVSGSGLDNYQNAIKPYHQEGFFYNKDKDPDFRRKIVIFDEKYKSQYWQPLEIYKYPHNIILNFWTELGSAGVILFIWIIGKFFYMGIGMIFRKQKTDNRKLEESALKNEDSNLKLSNWNLFKNWKLKIKNYQNTEDIFLIIGLLTAMTVIIVHGLVDVPYFKNDLSVMFWIFIAMMGIINLRTKEQEKL